MIAKLIQKKKIIYYNNCDLGTEASFNQNSPTHTSIFAL